MSAKLITFFALAGICLAAALLASAEEQGEHVLVKRAGKNPPASWYKRRPGSPTDRRTIKDAAGQQVDHTVDHSTGIRTSGYLALGKNARESSPQRNGQPSYARNPSSG